MRYATSLYDTVAMDIPSIALDFIAALRRDSVMRRYHAAHPEIYGGGEQARFEPQAWKRLKANYQLRRESQRKLDAMRRDGRAKSALTPA